MIRFKVLRQLERHDCGIACVRMIARHYGKKISVRTLKQLTEISRLGISLKDISELFARIGMDSASLLIKISDMYHIPCPAILYWRQRHFVVLYHIDVKRKIFYIADPENGKLKFTEEELSDHWKGAAERGVVIVAEPTVEFNRSNIEDENTFAHFVKSAFGEIISRRRQVFIIIILSLFCMGGDLLVPMMMQNTIDQGIVFRDVGLVWLLVAGQIAVFLGNTISSNVMQYLITKLGLDMNMGMTHDYLKRLVKYPLSFFDGKVPSDLIQKINDQSRIKDFIIEFSVLILFPVLTVIVFIGLLIRYNLHLFMIFLLLTIIETCWSFWFMDIRRAHDYSYFTLIAENHNNVYELINGMLEIKASGAQYSRLNRWVSTQMNLKSLSLKSSALGMKISGVQALFLRFKEMVITGICATFVINGTFSFGEMLTVAYIVGRLSGSFRNMTSMSIRAQDAVISYERLEEGFNENGSSMGDRQFSGSSIKMSNLYFRYPGSSSPYVIKNMNLDIEPGTTTAIVGESGCGKTTLIKLMLGFYIPQKGSLVLGETELSEINRDSWLNHCAVVMQSGYIFSDTIAGNIALSETDINIESIRRVSDIVGLSKFIESLPMGYNTMIGSSGIELSGGQKQRILIARALYKQPDILFLDEATSSLDATNERLISERILKFQKDKTLIIAAHRLSTVKSADRILYMEDGRILEDGTHDELIALQGRYFQLVCNQLE